MDRSNTDQMWDWFGTCDTLSGYRETSHTDSRGSSRQLLKSCYSVLQNCRYDESMEAEARFCKSVIYQIMSIFTILDLNTDLNLNLI